MIMINHSSSYVKDPGRFAGELQISLALDSKSEGRWPTKTFIAVSHDPSVIVPLD